LFLGTQAENLADMRRKGRASAKLSKEKAEALRAFTWVDVMPKRQLARIFAVHHTTIALVLKGRTWNTLSTK
jgi:hypothetical protein